MSECFGHKYILNGEIKPSSDFDSEKTYKEKSLYEVIRIIKGIPLFLEDHLNRLYKSAEVTNLEIWLKKEEIKKSIIDLSKANNIENGNVKIVFNYVKGKRDSFLCFFIKATYPTDEMYKNGVATSLYNAERQNPNAKVINLTLREATDKIIKEKGVFEVILLNRDGFITEGSRSNIFMVKDNDIYTAPVVDVLPGITRDYIIKACNNLGYNVIEKRVHYSEIKNLQGLFVSGTSPKVLPISKVDDMKFDPNNKIIREIQKEYDKILDEYVDKNR